MMSYCRIRGGLLAAAFSMAAVFSVTGCGSGSSNDAPAPVTEEQQKKTQDMLKNYGKQAGEQGRANAARRGK